MMKVELLPINQAIKEFQEQRQLGFFDSFLDGNAHGDILIYRGDVSYQGNLSISQLNPENLSSVDGIIIDGDLSATGTVSNYINQIKDRKDYGIELLITGSMRARSLISTNATVYVHQDLTAEVIYLFYGNGSSVFKVNGTLRAKALLINDEHSCDIDKCEIQHDFDLYECGYTEICEVFVDEVIGFDDTKIEHDHLIAALEDGRNIFR
jgi:hypothetical protein